jgi:hypothetical protein
MCTRVGSVDTAVWVGEAYVTGLATIGAIVLAVLSKLDVLLAFAEHAEALAVALALRFVALRAKYFARHGLSLSMLVSGDFPLKTIMTRAGAPTSAMLTLALRNEESMARLGFLDAPGGAC